jgi:hypothetical protein
MEGNSNRPKGVVHISVVFFISSGWADVVVCCHWIDLGKEGTIKKLIGVVMDMMDGIAVGDGPGVYCSVAATGTPTIAHLGHDV